MRAAYLGPPGTNSHDALLASGADVEPVALPTVPAVVRGGAGAGRPSVGLVPLENSREGAVGATLDALVFDAPDVVIVGELVHRVTLLLVAAEQAAPDEVRTVHSHPQALGQCARFLAEQLPGAALVVRAVDGRRGARGDGGRAAPGRARTRRSARATRPRSTARSCSPRGSRTTRRTSRASPGSRAPAATEPGAAARRGGRRSCFWGGGDRAPGWLVDCLTELSSRGVNLTRIESRPRRVGLGHYMFFCDLDGPADDPDGGRGDRRRCAGTASGFGSSGSFPPAG